MTWYRIGQGACMLITAGALLRAAHLAVSLLQGEPLDPSAYDVAAASDNRAAPPIRPDSIAAGTARRNPFRVTRSAASVRYDPRLPEAAAPPPRQRPPLVLVGVLSGGDPTALIDGVPGIEGTRVFRTGDRFGEFAIRLITPDSVLVTGRDTTWTLRVRSLP